MDPTMALMLMSLLGSASQAHTGYKNAKEASKKRPQLPPGQAGGGSIPTGNYMPKGSNLRQFLLYPQR